MKKSNKKKIKGFNWFRFCISISIIAILLIGTGMVAFAVLSDRAMENNETVMGELYTKYCVRTGDTLWDISKLVNIEVYSGKKDVRNIICEIKKINNLNSSNLSVGDIIYLPKL